MADDFDAWAAAARAACESRGIPSPDAATLLNMFDDGLEPGDAARAEVLARYRPAAARRQAGTVSDFLARHNTPDA